MLGMFKAMRQTMSHLPRKKITVQYPEQREVLPARSRGLFRVVIDPASGEPRCRSCTLCESNCPVQVIRVNSTSKYQLPAPSEARISRARLESQPALDRTLLEPVIDDLYESGTGLITVLQNVQDVYGYLPRLALQDVSLASGISLSQIYGVASFYNQFRLSPIGKYLIDVCHGTACHVAGAGLITNALEEELGIESGKTTKDMMYTLSSVACMGACSQAPVMRVGDETYGNLTPDQTRKVIRGVLRALGIEPRDLGDEGVVHGHRAGEDARRAGAHLDAQPVAVGGDADGARLGALACLVVVGHWDWVSPSPRRSRSCACGSPCASGRGSGCRRSARRCA